MLNRTVLMGRITHDLEVKQTQNGIDVLSFTVAVQRNYAAQGGERQSDFINCVAWRQQAEFISKYFGKGRMIALEGSLRSRTYDDKNGTRHYVTEVYVDSVSFTGEPKPQNNGNGHQNVSQNPVSQNNNCDPPSNDSISIGDLEDFEEGIISDEGVPF